MMYYSLGNVEYKLGSAKKTELKYGLDENIYHQEKHHLSSSVLKDYYDDVTVSLGRRVLKTYPQKQFSDRTEIAMRLGSAVHAYALEGKKALNSRFPVFTGARRVGKDWTAFKAKIGGDISNVLRIDEYKHAIELGDKAVDMLETYAKAKGKKIKAIHNECSLFAKFETVNLKVRPDRLILYEDGTFEIIDLKTTSTSVSNMTELSRRMENLKYPLSAAMYVHLTSEHFKAQGVFSIAWLCTETGMCAVHSNICTTETIDMFGWNHVGFTTYSEALRRYASGLTLLRNAIKQSKSKREIDRPYFDIKTAPSPWTEKNLMQNVVQLNQMGHGRFFDEEGVTESSVESLYLNQFREVKKFKPITIGEKNGKRKTKKNRPNAKRSSSRTANNRSDKAQSTSDGNASGPSETTVQSGSGNS